MDHHTAFAVAIGTSIFASMVGAGISIFVAIWNLRHVRVRKDRATSHKPFALVTSSAAKLAGSNASTSLRRLRTQHHTSKTFGQYLGQVIFIAV